MKPTLRSSLLTLVLLAVAVPAAYLVVVEARELRAYPDVPESVPLESVQARAEAGRALISLPGSALQCDAALLNRLRKGSHVIPIVSPSGEILGVADWDRGVDCPSMTQTNLVGVIDTMSPKMGDNIRRLGVSLPQRAVHVCMYCGPGNAAWGVVLSLIFALGPIVLLPFARRWAASETFPSISLSAEPSQTEVRVMGAFFIVCGATLVATGPGLVFFEVVPVAWVGWAAGVVGLAGLGAPHQTQIKALYFRILRPGRR